MIPASEHEPKKMHFWSQNDDPSPAKNSNPSQIKSNLIVSHTDLGPAYYFSYIICGTARVWKMKLLGKFHCKNFQMGSSSYNRTNLAKQKLSSLFFFFTIFLFLYPNIPQPNCSPFQFYRCWLYARRLGAHLNLDELRSPRPIAFLRKNNPTHCFRDNELVLNLLVFAPLSISMSCLGIWSVESFDNSRFD